MPRSSVGSAPGDALLDTYPVDDIIENTNCELHYKMKNISMKVVNVVAFTITPGATFHCAPIPEGYVLGNVAIIQNFLRITKINLWRF